MPRIIREIASNPAELATHLCWMAVVIGLIYGIQHVPLSDAWKTAISEGIAIFGGVELILDKIGDIRRARKMDELQQDADKSKQDAAAAEQKAAKAEQDAADARQDAADAEQKAADAEQKAAKAEQDATDARQDADELRRRIDELEEIVKNRPPQDDPEA